MVAQVIREKIDSGEYEDKLPTEGELMSLFQVSRVTIRKSIELLQREYPIRRAKKGGTHIVTSHVHKAGMQVVLIMPNNTYESIEIITGAEEVFSHSKIALTIKFSDFSEKSERAIIQELKDLDIAGFLIYPANKSANEDLFLSIMEKGIPLVFIDRSPTRLICSSVSINNQKTAIEIVDFLASLGHQDIVFFANELHSQQSTLERLWGYLSAMKKHRFSISQNSIYAFQNYEELQPCLENFFTHNKKATAVFCSDDSVAVRFIDEALRRGYRIPDDFSVVGIDNRKLPGFEHTVPLTTVSQPYRELGRRAAQIVDKQLKYKNSEVTKLYLPAELVVRDSVKAIKKTANQPGSRLFP